MAAFVLTDSRVIVGSADITQFTGSYTVGGSVAMQEANVHGAGRFVRVLPGLRKHQLQIAGVAGYDAGEVTAVFTPNTVGTQYGAAIVPQDTGTTGDVAFFTRGLLSSLNAPGGAIGDVATFEMMLDGDTALVPGQVLAPLAARTTTGNSSVLTMTGPTASQRLYAALHVTAASGTTPSMTVTVQSSTVVGMTSPTTRFTFSAATGVGWQFATPLAGAITDGFYRATFTISGVTPSFTAAVFLGVL
ncbi:MAG: hypothetical protein EB117_13025 [Betaproteobacteria bacterium]|nr:hypothetical protein [Betaproteobacteria bacterium]